MERMRERVMWDMREGRERANEFLRGERREREREVMKRAVQIKASWRKRKAIHRRMVNISAMKKEEARAYLREVYGEEAKPNWTAPEIKERIQQYR